LPQLHRQSARRRHRAIGAPLDLFDNRRRSVVRCDDQQQRETILNTTIAVTALRRFAVACLAAMACCAVAAPVTIPLNYVPSGGYSASGSVTYDDAIQVPARPTRPASSR
jgi:hypothetical protein